MSTRREFLIKTAAGSVVAATSIQAAQAAQDAARNPKTPLNVLLLVIDDARWDTLGAAGNKVIHTPRLDQLASESVRFRQAFVTTSICWVSRASILTGQYLSRHGFRRVDQNGAITEAAFPQSVFAQSVPALLRKAGYWTGFVGKWHLEPGAGTSDTDWDFARMYAGKHWMTLPGGERVHVTEKNVKDALDFLRGRPKDKPFFLDVSFFAPHAEDDSKEQYMPQDWSAKFYEGKKIPPPLRAGEEYLRALPPFISSEGNEGRRRYHWRFDTDARYQDYMTRYYRMITEVDEGIGRLIDELKTQGAYDNTLIVYIGDNGYFQADRGLADKWYPYEESIRVLLLVRDPRLPPKQRGKTRDEMALNIDVAPTILSAAGVPVPNTVQGEDLAPLYLQASRSAWRDEFFYEHPAVLGKSRIPESQAVVRRDWKYVYWPDFKYEQLFDLRKDPGELTNLAGNPAYTKHLSEMKQKLAAWRQRVR